MMVDQPAANHNGGHLAFGPDGYLYIGLGDGGGGGDSYGNGQDRGTLLGKLLRIDPLDPGRRSAGGPTACRRRTRCVGRAGLDEIWAWGLRNPWRFSFDRVTGDLWIGDVGQGDREEVDRARANAAGRAAGKRQELRLEPLRGHPPATLGRASAAASARSPSTTTPTGRVAAR